MSDKTPLPDFPVSPTLFNVAAKEAGFSTLSADSLMALGMVGEAMKKMGVLKIGRSRLLLSDEQVDRTFRLCEDLLCPAQSGPNDGLTLTVDQKLVALQVMNNLARSRSRGAEALIRSAEIDMSDSARPAGGIPSFIPKTKAVPVVTAEVIIEQRANSAKKIA